MKIYLFRHGEKVWSLDNNPPLSPKGLEQAQKISEFVREQNLERPIMIYTSPKTRAIQTLEPTSVEHQIPLRSVEWLLEKEHNETTKTLIERVRGAIEQLTLQQNTSDIVYLCSHFDWIEEFLDLCPCDTDLSASRYHSWRPCQWMKFNVSEGLWVLESQGVIQ